MNVKSLLTIALTTILFLSSGNAFADGHGNHKEAKEAAPQDQTFDLSEMTCWDVMTLEDAERGTVLFLYYGYVSGAKNELVHSGQTISKILSELGEYCSNNPDDKLLEVMMKGG